MRYSTREPWCGCSVTDVRGVGVLVEVEGVVEYKSLPSGLHNVTEDLVYVDTVLVGSI